MEFGSIKPSWKVRRVDKNHITAGFLSKGNGDVLRRVFTTDGKGRYAVKVLKRKALIDIDDRTPSFLPS